MNKMIAAATALALLAAPSFASTTAHAATWSVDHDASDLTFSVRQGEQRVTGTFGSWTAAIDFDPDAPEKATIKVTIETASVVTGNSQMSKTLTGEAWLASGTYPEATFTSNEVISTGKGTYDALGTLTIKDISVPMTLPFTLEIDGDTATARGGSALERQDYKIGADVDEKTLDGTVKIAFDLVATRD